MTISPFVSLAALALSAAPVLAQSNVSPSDKHAWSENCGWLDWRGAGVPAGAQGARLGARFLSGFVWGENIGWINLGDGSPANGTAYANSTGSDFGVNRDTLTGRLSGLAWGENVGWINFSGGALASPQRPATFDAADMRLHGFAWGENIGWINLDDATRFVAHRCRCDWDNTGTVTLQDIFDYLTSFFNGDGDFNYSGATSVQDVFDFVTCYFEGC